MPRHERAFFGAPPKKLDLSLLNPLAPDGYALPGTFLQGDRP